MVVEWNLREDCQQCHVVEFPKNFLVDSQEVSIFLDSPDLQIQKPVNYFQAFPFTKPQQFSTIPHKIPLSTHMTSFEASNSSFLSLYNGETFPRLLFLFLIKFGKVDHVLNNSTSATFFILRMKFIVLFHVLIFHLDRKSSFFSVSRI
jgi:hypothetical protein